jgi:hypothetical protein
MQGWIKGLVVSFVTIVAIILVDILLLYIGLGFNLKFPAYPVKPQSATQMNSPGVSSHRYTVHGK